MSPNVTRQDQVIELVFRELLLLSVNLQRWVVKSTKAAAQKPVVSLWQEVPCAREEEILFSLSGYSQFTRNSPALCRGTAGPGYATVRRRKLSASLLSNSHVFGKSADLRRPVTLPRPPLFARVLFSFFISASASRDALYVARGRTISHSDA